MWGCMGSPTQMGPIVMLPSYSHPDRRAGAWAGVSPPIAERFVRIIHMHLIIPRFDAVFPHYFQVYKTIPLVTLNGNKTGTTNWRGKTSVF